MLFLLGGDGVEDASEIREDFRQEALLHSRQVQGGALLKKCLLLGLELRDLVGEFLNALFVGLQELLGPVVIEVGADAFTAAKFGDGLFTTKALQDDADLFFGGEFAAGLALDLANNLFRLSLSWSWLTPLIGSLYLRVSINFELETVRTLLTKNTLLTMSRNIE